MIKNDGLIVKWYFLFLEKSRRFKFLGCWNNFGWSTPFKLERNELSPSNTFTVDEKIVKYLKSGQFLVTTRSFSWKTLYGETIYQTPTIFTDGYLVWSTAYIYYYENGQIELSLIISKYLEKKEYKIDEQIIFNGYKWKILRFFL